MTDRPNTDWDLVEDLVFQCLELRTQGADADVAVSALLGGHPPGVAAQVRRVLADVSQLGERPADDGPALRIPDRLGPYAIGARLGQGGMGAVYEGRDDALGRTVAVKVVRPDLLALGSARERFRREVEAVARLSHPGIVPVYQVGEDGGVPWFAMELVRGGSLAELLQRLRGRDPATLRAGDARPTRGDDTASDSGVFEGRWERLCLRWTKELADALTHAHGRSVLHRDVKPSNVVLDATGHARLCDFGLARADDGLELTRSGALLGSLPYVPPEQLRDEPAEHDVRGDVYSLGVTLYEMLTLRSPFLAEREAATRRNVEGGVCAPLRQLNTSVSRDVAAIVAVAMEREPTRRYQSMAEFAADLQRVIDRRPIVARPPGAAVRLWRAGERHPVGATVVVAACVTFLATAATYTFGLRDQRDRALAAQHEAQRLREIDRVRSYRAGVQAAQLALQSGQVGAALRQLDGCPEELRGFEWWHLRRQLDESVRRLQVSEAFLRRAAVTARGVFTGGADGVVRRVHGEGDDPAVTPLGAATTAVLVLDASADGAHVLSGHRDHVARLWNGETGALRGEFGFDEVYGEVAVQPHQRVCFAAAIDAPRQRAYAASAGGAVRIVDLANGAPSGGFVLAEVRRGVFAMAVSPDGATLAFARDHDVVLTSTEGVVRRVLRGHQGFVFSLEFSADGAQLLTASQDRTARVFAVADGETLTMCVGHDGEVHQAAFAGDGSIWTVGNDATLRQWDRAGRELQRRLGHATAVYGVAVESRADDGERIVTAGWDGALRWWEPAAGRARRRVAGAGRTLRQPLFVHDDGARVSLADDQHGVRTFATSGGEAVAALVDGAVTAAAARGDDVAFVRGGEVRVRGREQALDGAEDAILTLCWLDDGALVGAEAGGHLVRWSAGDRAPRRLAAHDGEVHGLCALRGGEFVSAGADGRVLRWSGDAACELWAGDVAWDAAALSADEAVLFVGGVQRVAAIELASGAVRWRRDMSARMRGVALASDGRRLLLAGTDRVLHVLDTADGEELLGLPADNLLQSVAVAGDAVVTATVYSEVDFWFGR
ncbi:MAG: protein kinase [Planctomycetes bacterium]|nr:protein kinase [Planctomycetota bacterium]